MAELAAMTEIVGAEGLDTAQVVIAAFERDYGAKYPKTVNKITGDADVLLEYVRYPAEQRVHPSTRDNYRIHRRDGAARNKGDEGSGLVNSRNDDGYTLIEAVQSVSHVDEAACAA